MKDPATRAILILGWYLLAVFLPLGLTLEALHAMKVSVYLGSPLRRELWTLAHAHGNLLGILCLTFASLAERCIPDASARRSVGVPLGIGAVIMPVGFLGGGILNFEGDPFPIIVLVPVGGALLLYALVRIAVVSQRKAP